MNRRSLFGAAAGAVLAPFVAPAAASVAPAAAVPHLKGGGAASALLVGEPITTVVLDGKAQWVTIKDLPLEQFADRVPSMQFEVFDYTMELDYEQTADGPVEVAQRLITRDGEGHTDFVLGLA